MTTAFDSGLAEADTGRAAGEQAVEKALAGAGTETADFALVFSASRYEYEDVLAGVREHVGDATIVGASTAGEFTEDGVADGSVTVAVIESDEMQFHAGLGHGVSEDIQGAVREAADEIPSPSDAYPHRLGINLHDGLAGRGEEIAMIAYQELPIPFTGGSAGDDLAMEATHVFRNDEAVSDGVVLAVIESEKPFPMSVEHGHQPISDPLEVTRADGSVVHELDGRPAIDVFFEHIADTAREVYGIDPAEVDPDDEAFAQLLTQFEFGIETSDGDLKVRWPGPTPDDEGPLYFATTIPEGTEMRIVHSPRDEQIASAREAARQAVADTDDTSVAGGLVFDCACRAAILQDDFDAAVDAIAEEVGAPLAGFETYGEVCLRPDEMRVYHNTTSSIALIPE